MDSRFALIVSALAGVSLLGACADMSSRPMSSASAAKAAATLAPTQGNSASGSVSFEQQGDGVKVVARVSGLKPNQTHGFHIHEKGDCSSPDGSSAGGHYNPTAKPHGPPDAEHHAGDMPSLQADASGNAQASFMLAGVSLGSGPTDLLGRGVIVHANPDDYKTQPTGNSGARIACGVIKSASA